MCTQRYSIFLAVNIDRTRHLQIFSLKLSQVSYPRNVVMSELTAYMSLLARLTLKEDDVNSEYHATRKYFAVNVDRTHEIQIFSLTTKLSPQRANERLNIRVSYINFLARLTLKQVEVNTEYHAPRKYCFMVFFVLA